MVVKENGRYLVRGKYNRFGTATWVDKKLGAVEMEWDDKTKSQRFWTSGNKDNPNDPGAKGKGGKKKPMKNVDNKDPLSYAMVFENQWITAVQ